MAQALRPTFVKSANSCNESHTASLSTCLSSICLSDDLADVYFSFPEENKERVPAHKMILGMRSPVFKAMFYGTFPQEGGDIEIIDIKVSTFKMMIRYLYTDIVELDGTSVIPMLYASTKYQVKSLVSECERHLTKLLGVENACTIYAQSKIYDIADLSTHTLHFIATNARRVFEAEDFMKLSHENLRDIIRQDSLCISEIEIFKSVLKWADGKVHKKKFKSRREALLKCDILYLMAIPLLSIDDFTEYVVPSGILTDVEELSIFRTITVKSQRGNKIIKFRMTPRSGGHIVNISVDKLLQFQGRRINGHFQQFGYVSNQYQENITLSGNRSFRIVSIVINPKLQQRGLLFAGNDVAMDNTTVTCYFGDDGDQISTKLQNKSSCTMELNKDLKAGQSVQLEFDLDVNNCFGHQFQNVQSLSFNGHYTDKQLDGMELDFYFKGGYLVESINVMPL